MALDRESEERTVEGAAVFEEEEGGGRLSAPDGYLESVLRSDEKD